MFRKLKGGEKVDFNIDRILGFKRQYQHKTDMIPKEKINYQKLSYQKAQKKKSFDCIASETGLSKTYILRVFRGHYGIKPCNLVNVCHALGLNIEDVIRNNNHLPDPPAHDPMDIFLKGF